ncbi:MAG: hypothetical protein K0Q73_7495 [Paenibacillus sp.]|jgi:hypothetical protein|nr:hypothetical protein [Paenibacillus sp.]
MLVKKATPICGVSQDRRFFRTFRTFAVNDKAGLLVLADHFLVYSFAASSSESVIYKWARGTIIIGIERSG